MKVKKSLLSIKLSLKLLLLAFCILFAYVLFVFFGFDEKELQKEFEARYSKVLYDRNGAILSTFINKEEQWHLKAETIPKKLEVAVLLYEDKNFYSHSGVDFLAILRALKNNFLGEKKSGASTISMQVIKLLEQNERNLWYKFNEMIKALSLEQSLSKDEILKLYLNNAPYGGNLVGFNSAVLFYFDKNPAYLTWSEAALLAVLPNAPGLINLEKNKNKLRLKRDALLHRLYANNHFDESTLKLALSEPLPSFKPRSNLAPHLALKLLDDTHKQVKSSIDKNLQIKFETKAKEFSLKLKQKGINNLAIILADTKSYETLAYIGSQDFYDEAALGQVNGASAKRSVGSVLKPFLYALSIDEGLIAPSSLMLDVPTFFSSFAPQNANKKYYGLIRADFALSKSLNVPFVQLLKEYGYEKFFYQLKSFLNFSDEDYKKYGLSLILGTKELSLEDMMKLYLALANYGKLKELAFYPNTNNTNERQIFTQGSAYLTLQSLKDLKRVGLEEYNKNEKIISYKTGTSYGRKDAWAMAATPKYTLGVWVGNFNGEANANLYGVSIAGDLLFELLGELDDLSLEFMPPDDLFSLKIDTLTGYRYDENLKTQASNTLFPREAKLLRTSPFLKKVFEYEGKELHSLDENFKFAKKRIKLVLPLNALAFLNDNQVKLKQEKSVKILYPSSNLKLIRTKDLNQKNSIIVKFANLNDEKLFLYLDQKLIFEGKTKSLSLDFTQGKHKLFVMSASGQSDSVSFEVE